MLIGYAMPLRFGFWFAEWWRGPAPWEANAGRATADITQASDICFLSFFPPNVRVCRQRNISSFRGVRCPRWFQRARRQRTVLFTFDSGWRGTTFFCWEFHSARFDGVVDLVVLEDIFFSQRIFIWPHACIFHVPGNPWVRSKDNVFCDRYCDMWLGFFCSRSHEMTFFVFLTLFLYLKDIPCLMKAALLSFNKDFNC